MSLCRIDARLRSFLGLSAVVATVALAMPGLQVARAEDDAPAGAAMSVDPALVQASPAPVLELPKSRPAPTCENPGEPSTIENALTEFRAHELLREIAQRAVAEQDAPGSGEQGIVLNGRGYNYRPAKLGSEPQ